jgi:MerR family transcriptional regulator, thiopeptide resistance regulator
MAYTVKQLSKLAGVSIRTLHYYDEIGLLKPSAYGDNGYRYYGDEAVPRLQQILFFKELDFPLVEIRSILSSPDFDLLPALEKHRVSLQRRVARLERLIITIDKTTQHMKGKQEMKQEEYFEGFSEEKQQQYEQEIRQRYGEQALEGVTDWNSYTPDQKARIRAESEKIYRDLVANMDKGYASPEVQAIIARWHQHLRYFYEPSVERLRGLGQMYTEHPDFVATFTRMHPDLPNFLQQAIEYYCWRL